MDERTNSLIVAGSQNDLNVIEGIVYKLEDADVPIRRSVAFKLRNALAADVASSLNDFINKTLSAILAGNQLTNYQAYQQNVVVSAEPITNTLLINATPDYFDKIMQLVQALDALPPSVIVQVLIAEVDLSGTAEFGVELGLQSPILFQRGIIPTLAALGGATVSYTAPTTGTSLLPQGVTTSGTYNPAAYPGLNFNGPNTSVPLGGNPLVPTQVVGVQGITNYGVGRVSSTSNVGGFVFSMQNDFLNVLLRALQTQNRITILSRPQLRTLDNQTALLNVGQNIPVLTSNTITATGLSTQNISRFNIGVNLQVTPKITPDGQVLMRVIPEVSSVVSQQIPLGNGTSGTAINVQHFESTITACDGETVVLGGLIQKMKTTTEAKTPILGDMPWIGWAFRYRTQQTASTELVVILTPHIIRDRSDSERILAEEARRIDWNLPDVLKVHGTSGMEPVMQRPLPYPQTLPPSVLPPSENLPPPNMMPAPTSRNLGPTQLAFAVAHGQSGEAPTTDNGYIFGRGM